ncbi:MAG: FkbM family methyltransferase [Proteobacteria bacterium]|nr:FkbM family methyltransferase [Pseudomonadota bacterium]
METIFGEKRILATTSFEMRMALDRADLLQREILTSGSYEPELTEFLLVNLQKGDIFYDVGANVGYHSLIALSRGARVFAFEPDPISCGILCHNLEINAGAQETWTAVQSGVGRVEGTEWFTRTHVANSGISGIGAQGRPTAVFRIDMISLDAFVQLGMLPPDVMKVDVEGWESGVFMGAGNLLSQSPPRLIVFEGRCDQHGGLLEPEIESILGSNGYRIQHLPRTHGWIESRENYLAFRSAAQPVMP